MWFPSPSKGILQALSSHSSNDMNISLFEVLSRVIQLIYKEYVSIYVWLM